MKRALARLCGKTLVEDELGHERMTGDMPLGSCQECPRFQFADHVPQVQIALRDVFDFIAANFTQITLIAARHDGPALLSQSASAGTRIHSRPDSRRIGNSARPFKIL